MSFPFVIVVGAWIVEALALGYVMGRRGYDAYQWTFLGAVLGPIAVAIALGFQFRPPPHEPRLLRRGSRGAGSIDVLVGVDGSPEARAAVERAVSLFGPIARRVTFARVIPLDATRETAHIAETQLEAARSAHPELDPSTVVLRGEPVEALREYVTRAGYEILVIGTRGEGKTRAVLGSVAMTLARGAGIPVLLVDNTSNAKVVATRTGESV